MVNFQWIDSLVDDLLDTYLADRISGVRDQARPSGDYIQILGADGANEFHNEQIKGINNIRRASMQTRHWQQRKTSMQRVPKEGVRRRDVENEDQGEGKIDQQGQQAALNFLSHFQQFYDQVADLPLPDLEYVQEYFSIEQVAANADVLAMQRQLAQQWSSKPRKNWSEEEKGVLVWTMLKLVQRRGYSLTNLPQGVWEEISQLMCRRTADNCKAKWISLAKIPLIQVPWTKSQDTQLLQLIQQFAAEGQQHRWSQIAFELNKHITNNVIRTPKQCRERWNNHLNPEIYKEQWSMEEDINLLELVKKNKHQWAYIAKSLKARMKVQRSENAVKNRFNCLMKKNKECKTVTALINRLRQKQLIMAEAQEGVLVKLQQPQTEAHSQNIQQIQVKIEPFTTLCMTMQLEPCLLDLNNKCIYPIDKEQYAGFVNAKQELPNAPSGISHYFESMNYVKYVPCVFPSQEKRCIFGENRSVFNIPDQQQFDQTKQFNFNQHGSFYNFQKQPL